ncbi:MAG: hypothetical protein R6U17_06600 [Thermoplasmata archaeon]
MDSKKKTYLRNALKHQRKKEDFNKSLSREVSKRQKGKEGYKIYIDLMNDIRNIANKHNISNEKAAKKILKK